MSKLDWKQNNIAQLFNLEYVESVLDVACGLSLRSKYIPTRIRVGVDIYPEYFKHIESDVPYAVIKYDVRKLSDIFVPKSFDIVIALDIVEHLEKEEALKMLACCEQIARHAVIVETPEGYIPQNIDILGYGGDIWQTHRSGWTANDFTSLGYTVKKRPYNMTNKKRHTSIKTDTNITLIDAIKYI